ncbi:MAG: hypothetical protein KDC44_10600, partial [Phaeodactylibacter sp.]|nr:hypothetical protein [Phaeodactylibacter sp.]
MKQLLLPFLICPTFLFAQFAPPLSIHEGFATLHTGTMADLDQDGTLEAFGFVDNELRYYKAHEGNPQQYYSYQSLDFGVPNGDVLGNFDLDLDGDFDLLLYKDNELHWIPYDAALDQLLPATSIGTVGGGIVTSQNLQVQLSPGGQIEFLALNSGTLYQLLLTPNIDGPELTVNTVSTPSSALKRFSLGDIDGDAGEDLIYWDGTDLQWAPQTSLSPLAFGTPTLVAAGVEDIEAIRTAHMDANTALDILIGRGKQFGGINAAFWYKNSAP